MLLNNCIKIINYGFGKERNRWIGSSALGRTKWTAIKITEVTLAKMINTQCQLKAAVTWPPIVGAIIGDTATTRVIEEKACAALFMGNRSLTRACAATKPAQPPICLKKAHCDKRFY